MKNQDTYIYMAFFNQTNAMDFLNFLNMEFLGKYFFEEDI